MDDLNSLQQVVVEVHAAIGHLRHTLETPYHAQVRQRADEAASTLREILRDLEGVRLTLAPLRGPSASLTYSDILPHIVTLIVDLKNIAENPEYAPFLRSIPYRPSGNERRVVIGGPATNSLAIIRALVDRLQSASLDSNVSPARHDLFQLSIITPAQKIAPAQFQLEHGRVVLKRNVSVARDQDRASVANAKSELLKSGHSIVEELERSNCDRRLVSNVQNLQSLLSEPTDAITIGIANLRCEIMGTAFEHELPLAVGAMLKAHIRGIQLFVGQFPEWNRFVENAASAHLSGQDIDELRLASESVISTLRAAPNIVDDEVPRTLSYLVQMLENPTGLAKRAAFAVLRSMENLISVIFKAGAEFGQKTLSKTVDLGSSVASKVLVAAMLTLALTSATFIGPVATKVPEMSWLRAASDIVRRELDRIAADK